MRGMPGHRQKCQKHRSGEVSLMNSNTQLTGRLLRATKGEQMIFATLFMAYCLTLGIGGYIGQRLGWWR